MYTVGLDVDTHFIMKNLATGVLGIKNYKNSSTPEFSAGSRSQYPETSQNSRSSEETSYFSGVVVLLKNYTSSEVYLKIFRKLSKSQITWKKTWKTCGEAEFGYYLAGLIEAGGYFGDQLLESSFWKRYYFSLLYQEKDWLGSVYFIKDKRAVKYVLRHTAELKYVLDLVNGKFLTNCKINQLLKTWLRN